VWFIVVDRKIGRWRVTNGSSDLRHTTPYQPATRRLMRPAEESHGLRPSHAHPTARVTPVPEHERDDAFAELLLGADPGAERFHIFTTLARHPGLFRRWMAFAGKLLLGGTLPARHREIVILRTLWLVRAHNEWYQHVRIARRYGITSTDIARVIEGPDAAGWSDLDRALMRLADELHHDSHVSDETWAVCAASYDDRQLIELPILAGQYHLVGFVGNAMRLEPDSSSLTGPLRNPLNEPGSNGQDEKNGP